MADEGQLSLPEQILTKLPADPTMSFDPAKAATPGPPEPVLPPVASEPKSAGSSQPPRVRHSDEPPFQLRRVIGRGGMGEVWEAVQGPLRRVVAVKIARPDLVSRSSHRESAAMMEEFEREAATTAALEHPNIVPVYDLARDHNGAPLLAMKLVRGTPWDKALRADIESLQPPDVIARHVPILVDVAQAVAFAHSRGIVHRDLKPAQVMLGEYGEVLLMDWGLAVRPVDAPPPSSDPELGSAAVMAALASSPAGTPAYMAPEQTLSNAGGIGTWTDVYLLGATLYHILTGHPPHRAESSHKAMLRASSGALEPPSICAPDRMVPPELEAIALRAMATAPADRYPTVRELLEALQDWLTGAGKRRVSEALAADATARLAAAPKGYKELGDVAALIERALAEWPGNPALPALREGVFARHAEVAMDNGDLVLARVQAEHLAPSQRREALLSEIERRDLRARRIAHQRQTLLKATAALSVATLLVGGVAFVQTRQAQEAEVQRMMAQASADRANAAAERSRALADVARRVNDLRREEYALAEEMDGVLGAVLPRVLREGRKGDVPLSAELQEAGGVTQPESAFRADVEAVLSRRDKLMEKRRDLEALVGGRIDDPPMRLVIADAYRALAFAKRRADFENAYRMLEDLALQHPESPEILSGQAVAAGRLDAWTTATTTMARAAEITRTIRGEFSEAYTNILAVQAGVLVASTNDRSAAIATYRKAIENNERFVVRQIQTLCNYWLEVGEPEEAERFASFALGFVNRLPDKSIRVGNLNSFMSVALMRQSRYPESLPYLKQALEADEANLGPYHPRTITALNNLSVAYTELGQGAESLRMMEDALSRAQQADPPVPLLVAQIKVGVGRRYLDFGRVAEGRRALEEAIATYENAKEDRTADLISALQTYAGSLRVSGELAKAAEVIERAARLADDRYPIGHPNLRSLRRTQVLILADLRRHDEAVSLIQRLVDAEAAANRDQISYFDTVATQVSVLAGAGQNAKAERIAFEAYASMRSLGHGENAVAGQIAYWVAFLRGGRGDWEGALAYNLIALRIRRANEGGEFGRNAIFSAFNTGFNYRQLDWYEEAVPYLRTAMEGFRRNRGPMAAESSAATGQLLDVLADLGRFDEVLELGLERLPEIDKWRERADRAHAYAAIAAAREHFGNRAEAARLFIEALRLRLQVPSRAAALPSWGAQRALRGIASSGNPSDAHKLWLESFRTAAEQTTGTLGLLNPQGRTGLFIALLDQRPKDVLALTAAIEAQTADEAEAKPMALLIQANDMATSAALSLNDRELAGRYLRRAVAIHSALDIQTTSTLNVRLGAAWPERYGLGDLAEVRARHRSATKPATNRELLDRVRDTGFPPPVPPFDLRRAIADRPRLREEADRLLSPGGS